MVKNCLFILFSFIFTLNTYSKGHYKYFYTKSIDSGWTEKIIDVQTPSGNINSTLTLPTGSSKKVPLVIIIPASGDIDRNGNDVSKNILPYTYQLLAHDLASLGIASVRYDKKLVGLSKSTIKRAELGIEDYVDDDITLLNYFQSKESFSKVCFLCDGQGVLIGSLAAIDQKLDGFIAINGTSQTADKLLTDLMKSKPSYMADEFKAVLDSLRKGKTKKDVDISIYSVAKPDNQRFLMSWCRYNPLVEFKKIKCPILIIQGDNNTQATISDAEKLKNAKPHAEITFIRNMSSALINQGPNQKNPNLTDVKNESEIDVNLIKAITSFINK